MVTPLQMLRYHGPSLEILLGGIMSKTDNVGDIFHDDKTGTNVSKLLSWR
jgi:hypothetical protein